MKPASRELLELCGAVRDETATPEQIARLESLLADGPEARRFYREFAQISATFERYEQEFSREPDEGEVTPSHRRAWRFGTLNHWLAFAASFVVLATLYFAGRPAQAPDSQAAPTAPPIAFIQQPHACMLIPRDGEPVELNGSHELRPGDIVATAAHGSAIIRFTTETSVFILSKETRAWLSHDGTSKIVHLTSGHIYGDIAPQQGGSQWRIITAHGEATVLGTRLSVSAHMDDTRVAVSAGRVRVTARDSGQSVETNAGFAAELTPTTARLVRLPPTEPTRVATLSLVDADTNLPIAGFERLVDGMVLDLAALPTRRLNIQANCEPRLVGMVRFELAGVDPHGVPLTLVQPIDHGFPNQIEFYYPYMLAGDPSFEGELLPQHSHPWTPPLGRYTLSATPYAAQRQFGARGESLSIRFEVIDSSN